MQKYLINNDSVNNILSTNQTKILRELNELTNTSKESNDILFLIVGAFFGAILGVVLTLVVDWIRKKIVNNKFKKEYSQYEGIYLAYNKYDRGEDKVFRCFELTRDKNKFIIKNGISALGHEDFNSVITMDSSNSNHGTGYFQHKKSPDNLTRFGFFEIQLANSEILVHEIIYFKEAGKKGEQHYDAYRWIKQDLLKKAELFDKYREIQSSERKRKFAMYLS